MIGNAGNRDRLRLLFLLPFAPRLDASHGGGHIMAQFLEAISTRHQVAVLYFRASHESSIDNFFYSKCELIEEVARPWTYQTPIQRFVRNGRLLASLARKKPMWVTDWKSHRFSERVRSVARKWHPDIVQIEYHVMAQYISALDESSAPRILTEYEPGIRAGPYLKAGPSLVRNLAHRFDQNAWASFEPAIIRQVQAVVVFTKRDQKSLQEYGLDVPIYTIPFGTPLPNHPLDPLGAPQMNLLFVGNFIHPPNTDAALRLVCDIFPPLLEEFPELKLTIVGSQPPPELIKNSDEHIMVTGWVPDLTPYLNRATIFVAPLRMGGGMRVKILEALAAGKVIVATPLAVEGLDVLDGEEVVIAENDSEIVNRIMQLLGDEAQRAAFATRARSWACTNLGWEKSIGEYERLYQTLLRRWKK